MSWLKTTVHQLPEMQKESIQVTLEGTRSTFGEIEKQGPWLNSVLERALSFAEDLPEDERVRLSTQLQEIRTSYREIRQQTEIHVAELQQKLNEKQQVIPTANLYCS